MANVLVSVCGGIAAYKACEVVRLFIKANHTVQVVMTRAAQEFVTPLTFESLTGHKVHTDLFNDGEHGTAHISLARWADIFVIVPATADTLARLSHGHAGDFLSTIFLAYKKPAWIAPAMNTVMWNNPAVQENLTKLSSMGHTMISPQEGLLACGEYGEGKLADPEIIVKTILGNQTPSPLKDKSIAITVGPTREYIDAVRFISSPSSGKMGLAIATELLNKGTSTTIIHGPLSTPLPKNAQTVSVVSAQDMYEAAMKFKEVDVFIACAAVADYTPKNPSQTKLKKAGDISLELTRTRDIAKEIGQLKSPKSLLIGFAAESENTIEHAQKKMREKNMDMIVANEVFRETKGFETTRTTVTILTPSSQETFKDIDKSEAAKIIVAHIERLVQDHA